jgi:hypothetical protein
MVPMLLPYIMVFIYLQKHNGNMQLEVANN